MNELYRVRIEPATIAGVYTESLTPAEGVPEAKANRVLINLHGGGFISGARFGGQRESIAVAALGKFKVISVDYRMGPEHRFPAASQDVEKVYRELLKTYAPGNIGIFGFSAGGLLTAQATAWLLEEGLPIPGALGMFCAAACYWGEGDSARFAAALAGDPVGDVVDPSANPYCEGVATDGPLFTPGRFDEVLSRFPPCLLISATRDIGLSSAAHTHSRLVALGIDANLHVWEGLGHGFLYDDPDLPQAREGHDVIVRFFDRQLGRRVKRQASR